MKKSIFSYALSILITAFVSQTASADILAVKAGVDGWYTDTKVNDVNRSDSEILPSFYVAFEHFIPIIPNGKLRYTHVTSGTGLQNVDFDQTDLILYYEILDNDLLVLDIGAALQNFNGNFTNNRNFNEWQFNLYGDAKVGIPSTGFSLFTTVLFGSFTSTSTADAEAGISYTKEFIANFTTKLGYRVQDYNFDYFNGAAGKFFNHGAFLGFEIHL